MIEFGALERKNMKLSLHNALGQEVYQAYLPWVYEGYRHPLHLMHVPEGVYVLKLDSEQGQANRRIVIRK